MKTEQEILQEIKKDFGENNFRRVEELLDTTILPFDKEQAIRE